MKTRKQIPTVLLTAALLAQPALPAADAPMSRPDGKPADMTRKVKVFILLGQSNMVGAGKVKGGDGSLEFAVKERKKYPYLVQDDGKWTVRQDVRFVQYMSGKGPLRNEWMTVTGGNLGPEYGIGHSLGNAMDAPVMILKCCIGNRALGWDLLPPGSERSEFVAKDKAGVEKKLVYAGYKDKPEFWEMDPAMGLKTEPAPWVDKNGKPIDWYAGKQWDSDIGDAKKALADLEKHYPGAKGCEIAGFFFWQGERDAGNAGHAAHYEKNLVAFIKALRKEFNAPDAKFVLGTLGEAVKGSGGPGGQVLAAHLAVDGASGKYSEFKGNVATIYTHPMAQGGSGNGHYGGKAEVYMDVGEAMGQAMVELLKSIPRETRDISGWQVHISEKLLESEPDAAARALAGLKKMLDEIVRVVPASAVTELRKVPLYFSPAYKPGRSGAEFHPDAGWLRDNGRDPAMARGVEFSGVHDFEAEMRRMPNFALHELAHAYQFRALREAFGNADIKAAYDRAKASGSYDRVERSFGEGNGRPNTFERAYAITDPMEYFAETTEAYFTRNDFFPFTREELKRHDPAMFALLAKLWGVPDAK